jgi:hypothetical protein
MAFPAWILLIRVGRRGIPLPAPLFLLWPIVLILWLLGLPLRVFARIWPADWLRYAAWGLRSLGLLWYTRGLRVRVTGRDDTCNLQFL